MEKIKVAHFSDLHYGPKNLDEADRCFEAAVIAAISAGVDCAVVTGDSTDHALDAHQPVVRALAKQIQRLANHCPVLLLQGTFSHEPPGFLRMLAMVGAKYPIRVADGISSFGLRADRVAIEKMKPGGDYDLVFHALPTLNKADLAAIAQDSANTHGDARRAIASVLGSWSETNRQLRAQGVASMVLSHGTVFDSISEHGVPMSGTDHELDLGSLFAADASGVALGHIHMQQEWVQDGAGGHRQVVAYPGSIGRFHHGEIGEKYWLLWSLDADGADIDKMPTPARRTVDLVFSGAPDLDELRKLSEGLAGADVRLRYEVDEEHRQKVDRAAIRAVLEQAGVKNVQIEGKTLIVQRQRAPGISTASLEEKMAMWCEATNTINVQELQQRLGILLNSDVEQIAKNALGEIDAKAILAKASKTSAAITNSAHCEELVDGLF